MKLETMRMRMAVRARNRERRRLAGAQRGRSTLRALTMGEPLFTRIASGRGQEGPASMRHGWAQVQVHLQMVRCSEIL
jgi:hypothetical protein